MWKDQPFHLEVWIEKDALVGFLSDLGEHLGVRIAPCRGYQSYTNRKRAIQRFEEKRDAEGKEAVVLYCGDLDPSGIDMSRFLENEFSEIARFKRVCLNLDDVETYNLPDGKIKNSDKRTPSYRKQFPLLGDKVYELDALPPGVLKDKVQRAVLAYFDQGIYDKNQRVVRHWRVGFTDYQKKIKGALGEIMT